MPLPVLCAAPAITAADEIAYRFSLYRCLLTSKPPADYLDHASAEVAAAQALVAAATEDGATSAQTAIRYALAHPAVTTVACGARTMAQLEENARAGQLSGLRLDVLDTLRSGVPAATYTGHRTAD